MPTAILSCTATCASTLLAHWQPDRPEPGRRRTCCKYLPALTTTGSVLITKPNNYTQAEITARVDQELTPKDKIDERYFSDAYILQGVENLTNLLTYADGAANHYYNSLISETHTFSPHIVNNFIISYQLENDSRGPVAKRHRRARPWRQLGSSQPAVQADQSNLR